MAAPDPTSTASLDAGTSTRLALIGRVIRRLGQQTIYDTNTNAATSSGTFTVATDATTRYEVGDILDFWEDGTYEAVQLTAVAATTLTGLRGAFGTTAAAHDGSTTPKRFRKVDSTDWLSATLSDHMDTAIDSLTDIPLLKVSTYTTSTTDNWYALPAGAEDVLSAYQMQTTTPVEPRELAVSAPRQFHSGFAPQTKAVKVLGQDAGITSFYVVHTAKHSVTDLNVLAQDIVVLHTARLALEAASSRAVNRTDPIIQGAESKIQIFKREEERLRSKERRRIINNYPSFDSIRFRPRGVNFSAEGSTSAWRV